MQHRTDAANNIRPISALFDVTIRDCRYKCEERLNRNRKRGAMTLAAALLNVQLTPERWPRLAPRAAAAKCRNFTRLQRV